MLKKIISEKVIEKILDLCITYYWGGVLIFLAYFTEFMQSWAPLSWGFLVVAILMVSQRIRIWKFDEKIKERQLLSQEESYIDFRYENGIVPIRTQNSYIAHVSKTGSSPFLVFIIFEKNMTYSSIDINPNCGWRKINFHPQYAIIEMWDIKQGDYSLTFV